MGSEGDPGQLIVNNSDDVRATGHIQVQHMRIGDSKGVRSSHATNVQPIGGGGYFPLQQVSTVTVGCNGCGATERLHRLHPVAPGCKRLQASSRKMTVTTAKTLKTAQQSL